MQARRILRALGERPVLPAAKGRIEAVDLARGLAIALMIVSHGVSGLFPISHVPSWGMVPLHALTKFSSSLFIVVFGIALALAFLPKTCEPDWPKRRRRLMLRGVEVFAYYKALTVVEMLPAFPPGDILDALLYQRFPIWVEILGFYAIALVWLPWVLPYWRRMPLWSRLLAPVAVTVASALLERHFGFFGSSALKALLVEDGDYYTWGQLSRLPLVMLGLLLGEAMLRTRARPAASRRLVLVIGGASVALVIGFVAVSAPDLREGLMDMARNVGKHPPKLQFMLYSLGGALIILALCLAWGSLRARPLRPLAILGAEPLAAFTFHIVVIFLVLGYLLERWLAFTYPQALGIALALVPATVLWIAFMGWLRKHRAAR